MNHFFDVGAHTGTTFDFLVNFPQFNGWTIWCFEPSPRHLPGLMERARALSGRYRIHVCPFGLRGSTAAQPFFQKDDARGDSFESYLAVDHETQNLEEGYLLYSSSFSVSEFILKNTEPGDAIFLKLDCEGSEYDLLSTLIDNTEALSRIGNIMVEWHTIKSVVPVRTAEQLEELYRAAGKRLERWGWIDEVNLVSP